MASYWTVGARNLKFLFENGARMTASNDGGIPPCTPAMIQHEINLLHLFLSRAPVKDMFTGADVIRLSTIHGAACLGIEADFGSIEPGKVADLAILDKDPFENHRVAGRRVAALFMDGRLVINNCRVRASSVNKIFDESHPLGIKAKPC